MVSSYFSTLEHVLIGCLPFTSFDPATENLTRVIGVKWNEKMKQVVDLSDPEAGKQFARCARSPSSSATHIATVRLGAREERRW
jgi:hypothetical protein